MAFFRGTRNNDDLDGTSRSDLMFGRSGDDEIRGNGGNDVIFGGRGEDTIEGNSGNDWLYGGRNNDLLLGGEGRDRMFGGSGNDDLFGGDDRDYMVGGSGRDSLFGGEGRDTLYGDGVFSFFWSHGSDDFLDGGADDDKLVGGKGNDTLNGGEGADDMFGGRGDDTYFVDNAGDSVIEKSGRGTDEVFSSVDHTLADNVENLTLQNVPGAVTSSYETDFEDFVTGVSIDGQDGWGVDGPPTFDESVENDGTGNTVWRVSNAVTSGAFGNQPFAPRPGGIVADTTTDPVNGDPDSFAGESSTGASSNRFFAQFDFASATGAAQPGLSITVSPDNGSGGRHGFFDLQDTGSGLEIVTFDLDSGGNFIGPITIASGLSYTDFHKIGIEIIFKDGPENDVVNYFLDGALIHTGPSWEQFYTNNQAAQHPFGVPVQSLIFRVSGDAEASVDDDGFFIDNLSYEIGSSAADLNGTGNALDNELTGNDGNNILSGLGGNDLIFGGDGNDSLIGGGDDDELDGGGGNDTAVFSGDVDQYEITLRPDSKLEVSDNVANRDGTDVLENIEQLDFNGNVISLGAVLVFDDSGVLVGGFDTIQAGIDATLDGYSVLVGPGTYLENIEIIDKNISVLSAAGRESTVIEGLPGSALGTVFLGGSSDGVQFGGEHQGFTVIGIDGPPGIEKGAFYSSSGAPGHTNLVIEGNEFVANGDSALTFEFNDNFDGVTIEGNIFSGFTFDPTQPIGDPSSFANQFSTENVARQLVVIGGGSGVTNTQNVDFINNEITGTSGGVVEAGETFNDGGTPTVAATDLPFGNTMVTIDVVGGSVSGNSFTGTTGRFGAGLRVRGPGTDITDNTFDNGDGGDSRGVFQQTFDGIYSGNQFIGDDADDIFAGSAGNDILIGGNGEDLLIGRLGADTLTGGDDADTFVVAAGDGGASLAQADLITDWEDGLDKIGLAGGLTFGDLTIGADGGNATISVGAEVLAVVDGAAGLIEATDFVGA